MTRPRTTTSPSDALGATLSDSKSRLINLEALAHRHDQPSSSLGPVGTIVDYIGTTAPSGWAILDGSTIANAQTLYPDLWAIIPSSFKSGTSIVLPDTRGRVAVGLNPSDADFNQIGDSGGTKNHTLSIAEMPTHSHTMVNPSTGTQIYYMGLPQGSGYFDQIARGGEGGVAAGYPIQNTGGGGAHNNLQPYITLAKIIKLV